MPTNETQSIIRAIAILDLFDSEHPELGVREIARQVDYHPSTVGRILITLTTLGILHATKPTTATKWGPKCSSGGRCIWRASIFRPSHARLWKSCA